MDSIEWEKDDHGDWNLYYKGEEKVKFITNQQKEDLEEVFNLILREVENE